MDSTCSFQLKMFEVNLGIKKLFQGLLVLYFHVSSRVVWKFFYKANSIDEANLKCEEVLKKLEQILGVDLLR